MLTNKDYCDYDTCVALKELGFIGQGRCYYDLDEEPNKLRHFGIQVLTTRSAEALNFVLAVHLYNAQKWLREEKGIFSDIGLFSDGAFYYYIRQKKNNYWIEIYRSFFHDDLFDDYGKFESYEEALAEGIKKAINILKDGKGI